MIAPGFSFDYSHAISHMFAWQARLAMHAWRMVREHGYVAMFSLLFFSGAGLPLPEDIPLIAAGVSIAKGGMTWALAGPVAWLGMMCGDTSLYIVGYLLGRRAVHLPVLGRHVSAKRLKKCEDWFRRWGIWAVGIGRLFAGIRTAMVVAAGTLRFNYAKLLMADGTAAIVSGGAFMALGYFAGLHADRTGQLIEQYRQYFTPIALATALALIIVLWVRSRRRATERRSQERQEIAQTIKPA